MKKILAALFVGLTVFSMANVADAYGYRCVWVRGHHGYHGRWIPGHRVCFYKHHRCRWINGRKYCRW